MTDNGHRFKLGTNVFQVPATTSNVVNQNEAHFACSLSTNVRNFHLFNFVTYLVMKLIGIIIIPDHAQILDYSNRSHYDYSSQIRTNKLELSARVTLNQLAVKLLNVV